MSIPTEHDDPINARILGVSEDMVSGFQREPFQAIADASGDLFVITDGNGALILTNLGIAGSFEVSAAIGGDVSGFALTLPEVMLDINTTPTAVESTVTIGGVALNVSVEAGPFVKVTIIGGTLTVGPFLELSGNFGFQQQGEGAERFTVVSFSDVTFDVDPDPAVDDPDFDLISITNGAGVFFFDNLGFAGMLSGDISLAVGPLSAGASVGVRINTRTEGLDKTVTFGGEAVAIVFADPDPAGTTAL